MGGGAIKQKYKEGLIMNELYYIYIPDLWLRHVITTWKILFYSKYENKTKSDTLNFLTQTTFL